MPQPSQSNNPKARVEDFAPQHQRVRDETEQKGKKPRNKKDDKDKIYGWRHYYKKPKKKDFEPGESLSRRMDNAPKPPPRRFKNATPGHIMLVLLREAHGRGALKGITADFTATKDSAGKRWSKKPKDTIDHKFKNGVTMLDVAHWLEQHDFAEVKFRNRKLQMYHPSHGKVRQKIMLARGKNIVDAPTSGSSRELATATYVVSESGVHGWVTDRAARKKWGRIEDYHSIQNVKKWEVAENRGEKHLDKVKDLSHSYQFSIVPDKGANPYKDFDIGDWIYVLQNGTPTKHRVRQIGLTWDDDGAVVIALTLSKKLESKAVKDHKRIKALTGKNFSTTAERDEVETKASDGVSPDPPSPPQFKSRSGIVELSWDGTDEQGADPVFDQEYVELHVGEESDFEPTEATLLNTFTAAGTTTATMPEYETTYYAKMVAVDDGGDRSGASDEVPIVMQKVNADDLSDGSVGNETLDPELPFATDGSPPASSPTPIVTGLPKMFIVSWEPPVNADPMEYAVHISLTENFDPDASSLYTETTSRSVAIEKLPNNTGLQYGVSYYFKIVASDGDGTAAAGPQSVSQLNPNGTSDIAVGAITAGHIESVLVLASQIVTAQSGRRVEISTEGIVVYEQNEDVLVNMTSRIDEPMTFRGQLEAEVLTVLGGLSVRGTGGSLEKDTILTLQAGTMASQVSPTAVIGYPTQALEEDDFPTNKRGLVWDSGTSHWFYGLALGWVSGEPLGSTINEVDTSGNHIDSYPLLDFTGDPADAQGGITKLGSNWYALTYWEPGDEWWVYQYSGTLSNVSNSPTAQWEYTADPNGDRPTIGNDGTSILIARCAPTDGNKVKVRAYNATTGSAGTVVASSSNVFGSNVDLTSVHTGSTAMGFSATRFVVTPRNPGGSLSVHVMNTSGTTQSNDTWPIANGATLSGMGFDGTNFSHLSEGSGANGNIVKYLTANNWTTESSTWWVSYTWYDSDATGGTHETTRSPRRKVTSMKKRARLVVTTNVIPDFGASDDPDSVKIYIARGSSDPASTAHWLNASPSVGTITANIDAAVFSGTNPPTTNNFPGANGALIKDSVGQTLLAGDGSTGTFRTGDLKPVGYAVTGGGAIVDGGWAKCDGTSMSTTAAGFTALFAKISYAFGGSGSNFNLPDLRSRVPIGAGTFRALGENEGLTESNRTTAHTHTYSHTHNISSGGTHTHNNVSHSGTGTASYAETGSKNIVQAIAGTGHTGNHNHGSEGAHDHGGNTGIPGDTTTQLGGGSGVFPTLGVHWLIKL